PGEVDGPQKARDAATFASCRHSRSKDGPQINETERRVACASNGECCDRRHGRTASCEARRVAGWRSRERREGCPEGAVGRGPAGREARFADAGGHRAEGISPPEIRIENTYKQIPRLHSEQLK